MERMVRVRVDRAAYFDFALRSDGRKFQTRIMLETIREVAAILGGMGRRLPQEAALVRESGVKDSIALCYPP